MKTIFVLAFTTDLWETATFRIVAEPIDDYETSEIPFNDREIIGKIFWFPNKPETSSDWDTIIIDVILHQNASR